jgi:hypothetical protein
LREKEKYIWVPFLDPEDINILSMGAIWDLIMEEGSPELISDYGAQRARLKGLGATGPLGLEPNANLI